jgi:beta-glucanase (GH16 family)
MKANGMLAIEAHKEDYEGANYTSASLHTLDKKEFLYGRIEVRAKVPSGLGTWPAIWILGTIPCLRSGMAS